MGICQILQSSTAYLMDAYSTYFASAIAATVILRSICGAVFPLISPAMFNKLGDQWAMTVFAILGLICTPIPFLFWVRFLFRLGSTWRWNKLVFFLHWERNGAAGCGPSPNLLATIATFENPSYSSARSLSSTRYF